MLEAWLRGDEDVRDLSSSSLVEMIYLRMRLAHFRQRSFHRHVAAHHARELAGDGEPEAGAAEALRGRPVGLSELLEQLGLLVR